ncbi:MAG: hypothetical protein IPK19_10575 [Chloroflexi bacterium]|nr:hypothetical protein [Chloroflexota bacterium]
MPKEGGAWHAYDPAVKVIETTGAGDAFAGALVADRTRGATWPHALSIGVSAARLALSGWGIEGLSYKGAALDVFPDVITEAARPQHVRQLKVRFREADACWHLSGHQIRILPVISRSRT